ncbi:MAG TPA: cytochrome c [Kiritimatiellia bacterium]|nr:cytochrome c [Kiritimatiellia bacterium]
MITLKHLKNKLRACRSIGRKIAPVLLLLVAGSGCELRQAMYDQPKLRPLQASEFFENGMASRPLVEGAVARGLLQDDPHMYDGMVDGAFVDSFPFEVDIEVVKRGQQRYNIFCAPCHDQAGTGNGMIVQRGFKQPSSFHDQRLLDSPEGYYYTVIKNGFGVMSDYAAQIPPKDRWAIVAYIRALQLGQRASLDDVPEQVRADLQSQR